MRTFKFKSELAVERGSLDCEDRHCRLWETFRTTYGATDSQKEDFFRFKNKEDPFCGALAKRLAPTLYFDFVWSKSASHTLETITIETLRFKTYKGGGFVNQDAWYDIVLCHHLGVKDYKFEKRFVCGATGTLHLRFWSDNVIPDGSWRSAMGQYVLRVSFAFLVAGEMLLCTSEPFAIYV